MYNKKSRKPLKIRLSGFFAVSLLLHLYWSAEAKLKNSFKTIECKYIDVCLCRQNMLSLFLTLTYA